LSAALSKLLIETAEVFEPLLGEARYKGAYGGRGSGKSQFFAELAVEDALRWPGDAGEGLRLLSFREIQKSLKESAKFLIEKKISQFGLGEQDGFKVYRDVIQTPGDGLMVFTGMQDHTADSVKSFEGFHRAWGEEAQAISALSLTLLRPTIRWEDKKRGLASSLWFGWNPRRKIDAVDVLLRQNPPANSVVVRANWRDNPWFPDVLEEERRGDFAARPAQYDHVWEGGYATAFEGAYFSHLLTVARNEGRVGNVPADPLLSKRAYWDIGGTGAKADARAIWITQFVGKEVRILDYRETAGQPLAADTNWLRESGYDKIHCVLPHDGDTNDKVHDVSYASALRDAGFEVTVIPNQGKGAAMARVEAVRRILPACWFNKPKTEPGLDALAWYHEKRDDARNVGLGPEHDWSSHAADAFGLMAVAYETHSAPSPAWPDFKPAAVV
jgi:phage terminase large subunit